MKNEINAVLENMTTAKMCIRDRISREPDGSYNEDYCKWCYANGKFAYQSKESLLDYLVANMPNPCLLYTSCRASNQ